MQVTETKAEGLKRAYSITATAAEIGRKMEAKIAAAQANVEMKGFRKGKAPLAMVRKMFGRSLLGEVIQETVDGALREHLTKTGDRPAMQPDVKITTENFDEGKDLTFSVSYEVLPTIPEVDFKSISVERMVVSVDDAAIDEAIQNLANSAKSFETKEGAAADGDQVVIDFLGSIDGVPFDGGKGEDYPLVLGSNSFIPGFEAQLVGTKAGDKVDVNVSFPDNYGAKHLAGKAAVFNCTVKEVKGGKPAPADDELAKRYGQENLAALRKDIGERLAVEYKSAARQHTKRRLLDALDSKVNFDLPEALVNAEAGQIAHQLWHDENPHHHGHDHPEITPTDEHKRLAVRRVRLGLLLAEVGRKAEITVADNEVHSAIMRQAMQYRGREREFFDWARGNPQVMQQFRAPLFEEKVVDYILELANVTEKPVTADELKAALEALESEQV